MDNKIINDNKETKKSCHPELVSGSCKGKMLKSFTLLVKAFRSGWDSLLCRWHSQARNPRIPSFANAHSSAACFTAINEFRCRTDRASTSTLRRKAAFTLAETMIVLVVLGIVVALTMPSLIRKQVETQNRTKIKKAMTTYEKAFNQMLLDNQLTTNDAILSWADGIDANCENTSAYYRKEDGSGCLFKNSGLWWFIGENEKKIGKVLLSTKKIDENDPNQTLEKVREYARDKKNMTAFYMTGYIDNKGVLRINDKAGANAEDKADIEKLYAFTVNWMYKVGNNNEGDPEDDLTGDEDNCPTTTSCDEYDNCFVRDCHGKIISDGSSCSSPDISNCSNIGVFIYDGDNETARGYLCSDPADILSCNKCEGEACESLGFTCYDDGCYKE